jgi:beta-glucanase (GH16 family)
MRARRCLLSTALFVWGCSSGGSGGQDAGTGSGGRAGSGAAGTSGAAGHGGTAGTGGTAGSSAGTSGAAGHSAAGTSGAAGHGAAGTSGAAGSSAGTSGAAGHGAAGTGGTAGSSAGTSGAAGHGGVSGGGAAGHADAGTASDGSATLPGWVLTWSDEFNGPDGSAVDPTKWVHDVGGTGWGNQELEYYTDGTQNAIVTGGNLVITATTAGASGFTCAYPSSGPCKYTSARLLTQGKFSQQYGRFEARIQIPEGQGLWPAFWMLGANIDTVNWPSCGETDIMENIGSQPSVNHGSLHMPAAGTTNDSELTGMYTLANNVKLGDGFHTYAVEWSAAAIKFYVDDVLYETQTPASATNRTWEFDHPFFILLNVAVGGQFPGAPDSTTTFPQTMKVDWVRVYQPSDAG